MFFRNRSYGYDNRTYGRRAGFWGALAWFGWQNRHHIRNFLNRRKRSLRDRDEGYRPEVDRDFRRTG